MSQPPGYARGFGFTDFATSYPSSSLPGASVDAEFNAVALTLAAVLANLAMLQRDDGALKNQIVTLDSMSPAALIALAGEWTPRGAWLTATAYAVTDVVSSGTCSYVCAVAHTSAALLATDVAAGKWVLLFDTAGSTPADGSVTTAKLADDSVTTPKIGFTGLDLSGNIRGATGIQAGTAPLGGLLHAKAATGAALGKVERTTELQGAVGYQIIGTSVTWEFSEAISSTALDIRRNGTHIGGFTDAAGLDIAGAIRATAGAVPADLPGIGLHYAASVGYLTAYDYTLAAWLDAKVRAKTLTLAASGVDVVAITSTGTDTAGTVKRSGVELGWLDIPQNAQSGAYTLLSSDRGKHIYSTNVAGQTIVVPAGLPADMVVLVVNDGTNPITVDATAVTMKLAGGALTGNRTIAANGMATLIRVAANRWWISGPGVS